MLAVTYNLTNSLENHQISLAILYWIILEFWQQIQQTKCFQNAFKFWQVTLHPRTNQSFLTWTSHIGAFDAWDSWYQHKRGLAIHNPQQLPVFAAVEMIDLTPHQLFHRIWIWTDFPAFQPWNRVAEKYSTWKEKIHKKWLRPNGQRPKAKSFLPFKI